MSKFRPLHVLLGVSTLLVAALSHAAPGDLDPSFGQSGLSRPGSQILTGGLFLDGQSRLQYEAQNINRSAYVWRITGSGALDTTLNGSGQFSLGHGGITLVGAPDAGFLLGDPGAGQSIPPHLSHYAIDGSLVSTFGTNGQVSTSSQSTHGAFWGVTPDRILTAAPVASSGGGYDITLTQRLLSTGALDSAFGNGGSVTAASHLPNSPNYVTASQSFGQSIYVLANANGSSTGGSAVSLNYTLSRITGAGAIDGSYGSSGTYSFPAGTIPKIVAIDPAERLLVLVNASGSRCPTLQRLSASGQSDTSWGTNGSVSFASCVTGVAAGRLPDGRVITFTLGTSSTNGPTQIIATLLTDAGQPDGSFGQSGERDVTADFSAISGDISTIDSVLPTGDGALLVYGTDRSSDNLGYILKIVMFDYGAVPTAFTDQSQTDIAPGATVTSSPFTVSGLGANVRVPAYATNGQISINGGAFSTLPAWVQNGDSLVLQQTASASASTATVSTAAVGGIVSTPSNPYVFTGPQQVARLTSTTAAGGGTSGGSTGTTTGSTTGGSTGSSTGGTTGGTTGTTTGSSTGSSTGSTTGSSTGGSTGGSTGSTTGSTTGTTTGSTGTTTGATTGSSTGSTTGGSTTGTTTGAQTGGSGSGDSGGGPLGPITLLGLALAYLRRRARVR